MSSISKDYENEANSDMKIINYNSSNTNYKKILTQNQNSGIDFISEHPSWTKNHFVSTNGISLISPNHNQINTGAEIRSHL